MVKILCETPDTLTLGGMTEFQGDLKKRTPKDIKALADSILSDGLIMPFAVWHNPDGLNVLLDGHGRLAALTEIALQDKTVAEQPLPVLYIKAEDEAQARKSLLQITSSYGKINKEGAVRFCQKIPEYKAPAIKFLYTKPKQNRMPKPKSYELIKIKVPVDKSEAVRDLLKQVGYIEVVE